MTEKLIYVVIAAAGKGKRMGGDTNKLYMDIDGLPVLARTIKVFNEYKYIDKIILVVNQEDITYCKQEIVEYYNFHKVDKIIMGGKTRQESVFNGLEAINNPCRIVLIHDGARPFIKETNIEESIKTTRDIGASCLAVPVIDTIKSVNSEKFTQDTLDRSYLWSIQTPQTFKYNLIMEAHEKAVQDNFIGTDDGTLVERLGSPLKIVMGSYENIKITTKKDLAVAEIIVGKKKEF